MPVNQLHGRTLPQTWGSTDDMLGEKLRLGMQALDPAEPQLCIEYLPNGRVASGTVDLDVAEGPPFALSVLRLTAEARGCSTADLLAELLAGES